MSDYSQDDLNAFFKGKLENADPDGNMWNVPPDFVFDNAINKVNSHGQQQQRTGNKKLILLLLIPLALLTCLLISNQIGLNKANDRMKSLEGKVISSDTQIAALQIKLDDQSELFSSQLKAKTEELKEAISQVSVAANAKFNRNNLKEAYSQDLDDNKILSAVNVNKGRENSTINNSGIAHLSQVNKDADQFLSNKSLAINEATVFVENDILKSIEILPTLSLRNGFNSMSPIVEVNLPSLIAVDELIQIDDFYNEAVSYGLLLRQNMSSLSMSGTSSNLQSYDNGYTGYGFSLQAEKSVSPKFDMQFSLGYDVINNKSQLSDVSYYNSDNEEQLLNGSLNYSMDVNLDTPFGVVNSLTSFEVESGANSDQEVMDQVTNTSQSLNVLSINIGPKYKWLSTKQWELFSTLSLGYNRILHYENEMNTAIKMNSKTLVEFRSTPPKINDINKNYLSAQVGFGLGFRFSETVQVAMSANYGRSLNSLRIAKSATDPLTYLSQWNSQIGLNFKF